MTERDSLGLSVLFSTTVHMYVCSVMIVTRTYLRNFGCSVQTDRVNEVFVWNLKMNKIVKQVNFHLIFCIFTCGSLLYNVTTFYTLLFTYLLAIVLNIESLLESKCCKFNTLEIFGISQQVEYRIGKVKPNGISYL